MYNINSNRDLTLNDFKLFFKSTLFLSFFIFLGTGIYFLIRSIRCDEVLIRDQNKYICVKDSFKS